MFKSFDWKWGLTLGLLAGVFYLYFIISASYTSEHLSIESYEYPPITKIIFSQGHFIETLFIIFIGFIIFGFIGKFLRKYHNLKLGFLFDGSERSFSACLIK